MIVNMDPTGVGAVLKVNRKQKWSRRVPAGIVSSPVAMYARARRSGPAVVVQRSAASRPWLPTRKWVGSGVSPRVAFSNLSKQRARRRAIVMSAARIARTAGLGDDLSGFAGAKKKKGVFSKIAKAAKKVTLKKVLKAGAIVGAATLVPGAGAAVVKAASVASKAASIPKVAVRAAVRSIAGPRVAATNLVKKAAKQRSILKKVASVVRGSSSRAKVISLPTKNAKSIQRVSSFVKKIAKRTPMPVSKSLVARQTKKASVLRKVASAVKKSARIVVSKNAVAKAVRKSVSIARKAKVAKIHAAMTNPKVKAVAILAAGGGAAAVLTKKAIARKRQQIPVGAGEGDRPAQAPINVMSVAPVSPDAEARNVQALAPAESEREQQRQAALDDAAKSVGLDPKPVSNPKLNPMLLAAAAAAVIVLPRMMGTKR